MKEHLSSLPAMAEEEIMQHEIVSVKERVNRRPSRTIGMVSAFSMQRMRSRPDKAYMLRDADVVRLKTSLYPEIDFFEDS
jgi:hypothetical protein